MITHLSHDIGWSTAIIALVIFVVCLPPLFAWARWEIRRYGRALRGARIIDAPDYRFRKTPAAASPPRGPAAGAPGILDDPFVRSTGYALEALAVPADNVVPLDRWSVGA